MINKALVVNDDATILFIVRKLIEKSAFADVTLTANNGEKALAYFEEIVLMGEDHFNKVPEFVFLDLHMPVVSGWDFLEIFSKKYASLFPCTKVVILSSTVDQQELTDLKKYAMVSDFISTPINVEQIKSIQEKWIESKSANLFNQASRTVLN